MAKVPRLGDTSLRYMAALYDPRSVKEEVWVPVNAQLSQKTCIFARGSFNTGTTGYGIVAATPQMFNDIASVFYSSATTVATSATTGGAMTNMASSVPNSPFASTTIGQNVSGTGLMSWRPVAQAIYVRYAGTELNRGGDMILFEEPSHGDLYQYSYNTALALDGAKRVSVSSDWQHVSWVPVNAQTGALDETAWSFSPTAPARRNIGIFINSAGASQPFDFEMFQWGEFVGSLARAPSISFNDPIGFQAIVGASSMFQQLDSVLGIEGFVRSVEAQLNNQSLPRTEPPHANFVGLLPFLPKLAEMIGPVLKGALKGGLRAALPKGDRQVLKKEKAKKTLVKHEQTKAQKKKK